MNLPKMADCSECGQYKRVTWVPTSWGFLAYCARCIKVVMEGSMEKHECQCQEHDCKAEVTCRRPALCGRKDTSLHLCVACVDCSDEELSK